MPWGPLEDAEAMVIVGSLVSLEMVCCCLSFSALISSADDCLIAFIVAARSSIVAIHHKLYERPLPPILHPLDDSTNNALCPE